VFLWFLLNSRYINIIKQTEYSYKSFTGDTTVNELPPEASNYSVHATGISASLNPIGSSCSTTLSVIGGYLTDDAEWHWYSGSCAENHIGTGTSVNVNPDETTTYFVRAEGTANNTTCVSQTINVTPASFNPTPGSLDFTYKGTAGTTRIILTNFNACSPWEVSENMDWITLVKGKPSAYHVLQDLKIDSDFS